MASKINETSKALVIAQAKRLVEILENPYADFSGCVSGERAELRSVMASIRRDTLRIDKEIYPR